MMLQKNKIVAIVLIIFVLAVCLASGKEFIKMNKPDDLFPDASITKIGQLADYLPNLRGTNGNTRIFYFDSGKPGATMLLLGGTHPNEPGGFITSVVILENIKVDEGRFIIIPQACSSGFTCTDPMEGYPQFFTIKTKNGERKFRFGSRVSNPVDQWPDPLVYSHYPSGQQLSGFETRNLNRAYPGRPDGTFTERVGFAIMELIKKEHVDIAIDLHEAAPEIPIINAIVTHEKSEDIGAAAVLNLEFVNLHYALELSPKNFHGLSHREWGDSTEVLPFLMETSNPIQGRLRGKTSAELILKGIDNDYKEAMETGAFRITYLPKGEPLSLRVGRHLQGIRAIIDAYNENYPGKKLIVENIPSYRQLIKNGVGSFLR